MKIKKACELYSLGDYAGALAVYKELEKEIGDFFRYNIKACVRQMESSYGQVVNVAYVADRSYLMPTFVSIFSLRESRARSVAYRVSVVLSGDCLLEAEDLKSLSEPGFEVVLIDFGMDYAHLKIDKPGFHVSTAAIVKFHLADIFKDLDRLLYIDGDTIVKSDLLGLYGLGLDGCYAAVVEDLKPTRVYKPSILKKLNISGHRGYFNSGVLLLNLAEIRRQELTKALVTYREAGVNFFMDQDAFNVVFGDKVKYVSCLNNLLVTLSESFTIDELKEGYEGIGGYESFEGLVEGASILHFASKYKPWLQMGLKHSVIWYEYYVRSGAHKKRFGVTSKVDRLFGDGVVVSLTSWPGRIDVVSKTIDSLLQQSVTPERIVLWLAREQFPGGDDELPDELSMLRSECFEIRWCDDLRSYKKLIPSLGEFEGCVLVTADDDIVYDKDWLFGLLVSYMSDPKSIHCYRAHRIDFDERWVCRPYNEWKRDVLGGRASYFNFFTGCGGVLYPVGSLYHHVDRVSVFQELCPTGDDIWFWGMAVLNGTKVKVASDKKFNLNFVPSSQDTALWRHNDAGGGTI